MSSFTLEQLSGIAGDFCYSVVAVFRTTKVGTHSVDPPDMGDKRFVFTDNLCDHDGIQDPHAPWVITFKTYVVEFRSLRQGKRSLRLVLRSGEQTQDQLHTFIEDNIRSMR